MSDQQAEYPPARVHVVSSDVPLGGEATRQRPRIRLTPTTIVLTANFPVRNLLPLSEARDYAIIQALDNPIVICDSQGQAQSESNSVTALTSPDGAVIPTGVVVPLRNANPLWVTAATFPSRVSVLAATEE